MIHPKGCLLTHTAKGTNYLCPLPTVGHAVVSSNSCLLKFNFKLVYMRLSNGEDLHQVLQEIRRDTAPSLR